MNNLEASLQAAAAAMKLADRQLRDAYPENAIAGKMSHISPAVTAATRAVLFAALVPTDGVMLDPGTFARVIVRTNTIDPDADPVISLVVSKDAMSLQAGTEAPAARRVRPRSSAGSRCACS